VTRAIGAWRFNHLAALHLRERPPAGHDLDLVVDGFCERVLSAVAGLAGDPAADRPLRELVAGADPWARELVGSPASARLVAQAAAFDVAERAAQKAPWGGVWRPRPEELGALEAGRIVVAPSVRLVRQDWALAQGTDERLPETQAWVWSRTLEGVACRRVDPVWATLLEEVAARPFGAALEATSAALTEEEERRLRARLREWIGASIAHGWWAGLAQAP
jgi:hypothetical protein